MSAVRNAAIKLWNLEALNLIVQECFDNKWNIRMWKHLWEVSEIRQWSSEIQKLACNVSKNMKLVLGSRSSAMYIIVMKF